MNRKLTFQKQTKFHNSDKNIRGNCMITCYANYLGYKIEDCPAFEELFACNYPGDFWYECIKLWFNLIGYQLHHTTRHEDVPCDIDYYFAYGVSPRDNLHQVIYKNGKLFFDPSLLDEGILNEVGFEWLTRLPYTK